MQYFYDPSVSNSDKHFILNAEESFHAVKVLRHSKDDVLNLLNGKGGKFKAKIQKADHRGCEMEMLEFTQDDTVIPKIHIALALLKNRERLEWFVEKAIEMGVSELSFFTSNYAEKKGMNAERINKIAVSALKQSGNTWLPQINPLLSFEKLVRSETDYLKFIAYCPADVTEHLKTRYTSAQDAIILIGPEGDFTEEEVVMAKDSGFMEVSLGKNRLRAETAAFVSLCILKLANE